MAAKIPVKAIFTGSDVTSLGEFTSSDTIAGSYLTDGSVTAAKLAADTATQAELDVVSGVANAALPKAGGTMTGTLAMGANAITSTGTISSGAITAAGTISNSTGTIDAKILSSSTPDISTGESSGLRLINTNGSGSTWHITCGKTGSNNADFTIRNGVTDTNVLTSTVSGNITIAAPLYASDGSAGSPAYSFSADTDTGMFRSAANSLSFATGSLERWRMENDGDFHADGDVVAYSTTISDERLKHKIEPITDALAKVSQLNGVTFTYNADNKKSAGLIAQDVEKVLPSAVSEKKLPLKIDDGQKYKVLQYDQTIGLLVEAIKELTAKVEELEKS